jgi:hypothetical protein
MEFIELRKIAKNFRKLGTECIEVLHGVLLESTEIGGEDFVELGRIRSALSATNGQKQNGELSGRLLTEIHKMLDAYFERYEGRSAENLDTLRSEIAEVLCDLPQISRLNASLGKSVTLLLSNAGKVPRDQAAAWAEQTFSQ